MPIEQRTARLTVLIDPDKKAVFEHLCDRDDVTPSQVIRRMIRDYIEQRTGSAWQPGQRPEDLLEETLAPSPPGEAKRAKGR
jgi:hypothetical protein